MKSAITTSIHAAVWGPRWDSAGLEPTLERAARLGYDHVVVPLRAPATLDISQIARAFERHGLVPLNTAGIPPTADIGSADRETRERGVAHLRQVLRAARDMGSPQINGVLYGPLVRAVGPATGGERQRAADSIAVVADEARALGLRLALEIVNRYETNRLNTVAEGLDFLARVGVDNVGLHLDTFHMSIEESDPLGALLQAGERVYYLELDQSHRGNLCQGSLDLQAWLGAAMRAGYRGMVGVEAFSRSRLAAEHADALAVWRDTYDDADALAAQALALIRRALAGASEA